MALFGPRVCEFFILGPSFGILDISSLLYVEFLTRNLIYQVKIAHSGVQRPKIRTNETRKVCKIEGLDFLSYDFLSYASTVVLLGVED